MCLKKYSASDRHTKGYILTLILLHNKKIIVYVHVNKENRHNCECNKNAIYLILLKSKEKDIIGKKGVETVDKLYENTVHAGKYSKTTSSQTVVCEINIKAHRMKTILTHFIS